MFRGMADWERVAATEVGIGDRIDVDGHNADVIGILDDGDAREFEVTIHMEVTGGPDNLVIGKYTPEHAVVMRMRT